MINSTALPFARVERVAGQRVTILCPDGDFVIEAPHAHGVSLAALTKPRDWVFGWAPTPEACAERPAWTEIFSRQDALRGVAHLRRTMKLLTAQDLKAALQAAKHLPEPYMPVWVLLQAEATRRG
jgi:hypothetical protein